MDWLEKLNSKDLEKVYIIKKDIFHKYIIDKIKNIKEIVEEYNENIIDKVFFLNELEKYSKKLSKAIFFLREDKFRYAKLYGYKEDIKFSLLFKYKIGEIIREFSKIPTIKDKNIFNNDNFLNSFYTIFENILYLFGVSTMNMGDFVIYLKKIVDNITYDDFMIIDCKNNLDERYNCGRAFMRIEIPHSKFLIFNTNSDGMIDEYVMNTYNKYSNLFREEKIPTEIEQEYKEIDIGNLKNLYTKYNWDVKRYKNKDDEKVVILKDGIKYEFVFFLIDDGPYFNSYSINGRTFGVDDINYFPKNIKLICPGFFVKFFLEMKE